jgi:hypothetical protein
MWGIIHRVLAGIGLVLAVAGFIAFTGAAIGVWWVKAETNRRTDALAEKANTAVDAADHAVGFVREVIKQADDDLKMARNPENAPQTRINPFLQLTAREASQNLAGSVDRASAAVVTASDAVVVGEAAVQLLGKDERLANWLGLKPEQLVQTRTGLGSASRELTRVRTVLGIPVDAQPTAEQLVTVESALGQAREYTEQMGRVVAAARQQVEETKREVDLWVLRLAIGITVIGALGATGQVFMARACWRALRTKAA